MKKLLMGMLSLAAMFAAVVGGEMIGGSAANKLLPPDIDAMLVQAASKLNERLPMMVDEQTRLDSTAGGPGLMFTYRYTLPSHASTDIDAQSLERVIVPGVRRNECASPQMRELFGKGVTAHLIYRGNDGVEITHITVTPADCGIDA